LGELTVREVVPAATNPIVEVIALRQRRFQQFAAEKLVNQKSSHIALPSGWVLSGPLSRGRQRPGLVEGASHLLWIELHSHLRDSDVNTGTFVREGHVPFWPGMPVRLAAAILSEI